MLRIEWLTVRRKTREKSFAVLRNFYKNFLFSEE